MLIDSFLIMQIVSAITNNSDTKIDSTTNTTFQVIDTVQISQYQPIVDSINNGLVVKTDWWMFSIVALNAIAFIMLTIALTYKNINLRNMERVKSLCRNPVVLTIAFCLIGLTGFFIINRLEFFFSVIGILLTVLLIKNAEIQNEIQRKNIKLQLFDKRYAVYEAIAVSEAIIKEKDYSDLLLTEEITPFTINKMVKDANENLGKQRLLSQALFDYEIYIKIRDISNAFNNITKLHFKLYKQHIELKRMNPAIYKEFDVLFSNIILASTEEDISQCNRKLETNFPIIHKTIIEFNSAVTEYSNFISKSEILTDFNKYLIVRDLDK